MTDDTPNRRFPWLKEPNVDAMLLEMLDTEGTDTCPRIGHLTEDDKARLTLLMHNDNEYRELLIHICLSHQIATMDVLELYTTRQLMQAQSAARLTGEEHSEMLRCSYACAATYYTFWYELRKRLQSYDTLLSIGRDFGVHITGSK